MTKTYPKTKKGKSKLPLNCLRTCRRSKSVVVGEFNNWDPTATPMKRKRDGSFSVALNLESGKEYRFKYFLDEKRWENDPQPDRLEVNAFGTHDSVIVA